jgi:hypothetical protein
MKKRNRPLLLWTLLFVLLASVVVMSIPRGQYNPNPPLRRLPEAPSSATVARELKTQTVTPANKIAKSEGAEGASIAVDQAHGYKKPVPPAGGSTSRLYTR